MKSALFAAPLTALILVVLPACSPVETPAAAHRPVRSVELRYADTHEVQRYFAAVQARREIDQAFRVGGKVDERRVDVGQKVREGDIIAVLDAVDYRLAKDAALRQSQAAEANRRQASADWERMRALVKDGSVSESDAEHAKSTLDTAVAAALAEKRKLELATNQVEYTVLRAPQSGVVTQVRFEAGQVVALGQPVVSIADEGEPEIIVDVPEDHLEKFRNARFRASLATAGDATFAVELRELSAQATVETRTYRARLKPVEPRSLPLGASATLVAEHVVSDIPAAAIPALALTQHEGKPAVWIAQPVAGDGSLGRVALVPVDVRGYRNEEVLVTGPQAGTVVVTAGLQKMSPGLIVALPAPTGTASTGTASMETALAARGAP